MYLYNRELKREYIDNYNSILSNCNVGISILYKIDAYSLEGKL